MNSDLLNKHTMRYVLLAVFAIVAAAALVFALVKPALADTITVPAVPDNLKITDGAKVFLVGHATGTQNYICLPSGSGFAFQLFTPQATLSDEKQDQIITHFFSVTPKDGVIRATWMSSQDSSTIWAALAPNGASTNENFVEKDAVAWLLLNVVDHRDGPNGGDKLSSTIHVQRLNTHGGVAPKTGCATLSDVGTRAFQPYTADYFFYR